MEGRNLKQNDIKLRREVGQVLNMTADLVAARLVVQENANSIAEMEDLQRKIWEATAGQEPKPLGRRRRMKLGSDYISSADHTLKLATSPKIKSPRMRKGSSKSPKHEKHRFWASIGQKEVDCSGSSEKQEAADAAQPKLLPATPGRQPAGLPADSTFFAGLEAAAAAAGGGGSTRGGRAIGVVLKPDDAEEMGDQRTRLLLQQILRAQARRAAGPGPGEALHATPTAASEASRRRALRHARSGGYASSSTSTSPKERPGVEGAFWGDGGGGGGGGGVALPSIGGGGGPGSVGGGGEGSQVFFRLDSAGDNDDDSLALSLGSIGSSKSNLMGFGSSGMSVSGERLNGGGPPRGRRPLPRGHLRARPGAPPRPQPAASPGFLDSARGPGPGPPFAAAAASPAAGAAPRARGLPAGGLPARPSTVDGAGGGGGGGGGGGRGSAEGGLGGGGGNRGRRKKGKPKKQKVKSVFQRLHDKAKSKEQLSGSARLAAGEGGGDDGHGRAAEDEAAAPYPFRRPAAMDHLLRLLPPERGQPSPPGGGGASLAPLDEPGNFILKRLRQMHGLQKETIRWEAMPRKDQKKYDEKSVDSPFTRDSKGKKKVQGRRGSMGSVTGGYGETGAPPAGEPPLVQLTSALPGAGAAPPATAQSGGGRPSSRLPSGTGQERGGGGGGGGGEGGAAAAGGGRAGGPGGAGGRRFVRYGDVHLVRWQPPPPRGGLLGGGGGGGGGGPPSSSTRGEREAYF